MRAPLFDRTDFLLTRALLLIVGLGVPAYTVGRPLLAWFRGGPLTGELPGLGSTTVPTDLSPAPGVSLSGTEAIAVRIDSATTGAWLVSLLPGLALSATAVVIAWQLLQVVRRIQTGQAFVPSTASALRVIALALFVGSVVLAFATGVADAEITQQAVREPAGMSVDFPVAPIIGAMLVLALAEAFAQGVRLQDDVVGLV